MLKTSIPIIGFVAASGTGKTTLLIHIIPKLKQRGFKVALIKHSHHNFEIDHAGKDSFRLRAAGASPVMLVSPYRRAVITEFTEPAEPCLDEQLSAFEADNIDLILVEGFKHEHFPKIELHRESLNKPLLYPKDPNIIAVASDTPLEIAPPLTLLDINDTDSCAEFIVHYLHL